MRAFLALRTVYIHDPKKKRLKQQRKFVMRSLMGGKGTAQPHKPYPYHLIFLSLPMNSSMMSR